MANPTTTGGPSKDKLKLLFNTHMVTIEVGIEKEHFVVHQSFLCAKSEYFAKALSGSFQEGITRFVRLPDVSPILFRIFVAWVYHGSLVYLPPDEKTIDEDFESLEITEKDLEQGPVDQSEVQSKPNQDSSDSEDSDDDKPDDGITKMSSDDAVADDHEEDTSPTSESTSKSSADDTDCKGDDPSTWTCDVLIKLYIFADRFAVSELRDDSLTALTRITKRRNRFYDFTCVRFVYSNTPASSGLRKFLVHRTAYHRTFGDQASVYEVYPVEFLAAVMVLNSRRLPFELCADCIMGDNDVAPYQRDVCFFHEHKDADEEKACRLRREGA